MFDAGCDYAEIVVLDWTGLEREESAGEGEGASPSAGSKECQSRDGVSKITARFVATRTLFHRQFLEELSSSFSASRVCNAWFG